MQDSFFIELKTSLEQAIKVEHDDDEIEAAFVGFLSDEMDKKPELIKPVTKEKYQKTMAIRARIDAARQRVQAETKNLK